MSVPENNPPDPRHLAGWWTDGNVEPDESLSPAAFGIEPPDETARPLPDQARLHAADMQLLHALLLHSSRQEPARRQIRLKRAIQAIRRDSQPTTGQEVPADVFAGKSYRRIRWLVQWVVAASVLIAVASWLYLYSDNSAVAALEQIVQAIDDSPDRTYEVTVEPTDDPAKRERQPPALGDDNQPPGDRRSGLDGAVLYARDGDQFVLYRSTPSGRLLINGSNGRENWLVRPDGTVLVSSDSSDFRLPMPENLATIPLVDIRSSLTNLRHGYQIEELPAESMEADASTQWRHLRAAKIDPVTKGPKAVSVWFHPTTHLIVRIRFEQIHLQGRPEPRRMTMSLVSHQPLSGNWFDHEAHHSPDAPIQRLAP